MGVLESHLHLSVMGCHLRRVSQYIYKQHLLVQVNTMAMGPESWYRWYRTNHIWLDKMRFR